MSPKQGTPINHIAVYHTILYYHAMVYHIIEKLYYISRPLNKGLVASETYLVPTVKLPYTNPKDPF